MCHFGVTFTFRLLAGSVICVLLLYPILWQVFSSFGVEEMGEMEVFCAVAVYIWKQSEVVTFELTSCVPHDLHLIRCAVLNHRFDTYSSHETIDSIQLLGVCAQQQLESL